MKNRIFYDDNCKFCKRMIQRVKQLDTSKEFNISSINGKKAKTIFTGNYSFLRKKTTLILLEGQRVLVKGNALLRIFYLLGGYRKILGSLYILPGFIINPFYKICTWLIK